MGSKECMLYNVTVKSVRLLHGGATVAVTATPESNYQQNAWHFYSPTFHGSNHKHLSSVPMKT